MRIGEMPLVPFFGGERSVWLSKLTKVVKKIKIFKFK